MSMFSGFTSQLSGWVANKTGGGQATAEDDINAQMEEQTLPDAQEEPVEDGTAPQAGTGVAGFAKGLLQKGLSVKENLKDRASALNTQNLQGLGSNFMGGISNLIPGRKEEEVLAPSEANPMEEEMMIEGDQQYLQQE